MPNPPIPRNIVNTIAGAADVDPSTVRKVLAGAPINTPARRRIAREVRRQGLDLPLNEPTPGLARRAHTPHDEGRSDLPPAA